jgi:hypothetical protein
MNTTLINELQIDSQTSARKHVMRMISGFCRMYPMIMVITDIPMTSPTWGTFGYPKPVLHESHSVKDMSVNPYIPTAPSVRNPQATKKAPLSVLSACLGAIISKSVVPRFGEFINLAIAFSPLISDLNAPNYSVIEHYKSLLELKEQICLQINTQ